MGFLITLPSNSSEKFYPDNTISNFNTYLPEEISLETDYEVALMEIQYTNTFYNVYGDSRIKIEMISLNPVSLNNEEETKYSRVKEGYYRDIDQLISAFNEALEEKLPPDLKPKVEARYMTIPRKIKMVIQRN